MGTRSKMCNDKIQERWIQEGEKSAKYFLNLGKRNIVNKTVTSLQTEDGNVITSQEELLKNKLLKDLYKKR